MDHRDTAHCKYREKIEVEDEDGITHELPTVWVVCPTCDGKGTYVNPSIDSHGIGAEEWANEWCDDEREMYMSGAYDVTCEECRGRTTVLNVDEKKCPKDLLELYHEQQKDLAEMRREMCNEQRFGY